MKDAPIPNLTSLATSVRPPAAIFQISRSNISGTAQHKCTKFEQAIDFSIFKSTLPPNFMILTHSVRLHNAKNGFKYTGPYL